MPDTYGGRGPLLLGVTWAEAALTLVLFALRAKTASICPPESMSSGIFGLRWDFVWAVFALMIALAAQCTMTVSVKYGLGMHQGLLSDADIVQTNLWSWIAQAIGIVDLAAARCAVIAFLLALQTRTHRKGRWVLFFVGGLQGAINIAEIGVIFHQCNPPRKLWDMSVPGTCDLIDVCLHIGYFQGAVGAAADIFLAFYPVYIIGRLQQMRLGLKIGLCLLMSGGIVAGVAGINKTIAIANITEATDQTYAIAQLNIWVLTEMWFILIFGSIPVLRPFFVRFSQSIKSAAYSSRNRSDLQPDPGSHNDAWMYLHDRPQLSWASQGSGRGDKETNVFKSNSEEEILGSQSADEIVITRKMTMMEDRH
ncbi:hypothetical protein P170DRAFT_510197 [Aspergillus steynii IBT 23096]|uniref:Rhodopsin domain-containing protein n=1 Tax=Aspergillus steynii IBT 23096 TaxID=1392250 RepID=A0A2I2GA13_9EURO|nr:uncharacterized protein P170DRAFT_510197 [Aspergillus steynii IBT 23096]PLB49693.1 hypothetical protein P170DRAFT_510197 [Aspergillus steynii IBT 23096]